MQPPSQFLLWSNVTLPPLSKSPDKSLISYGIYKLSDRKTADTAGIQSYGREPHGFYHTLPYNNHKKWVDIWIIYGYYMVIWPHFSHIALPNFSSMSFKYPTASWSAVQAMICTWSRRDAEKMQPSMRLNLRHEIATYIYMSKQMLKYNGN